MCFCLHISMNEAIHGKTKCMETTASVHQHWPHQWAPRCSSFRGSVVLWGQIHDLHTAQCVLQDVYTSQLGGTHTCLLSSALPIVDLHPPPFNTRFFRPISESVPKLAHDLFSHFCTAHQYAHIHRPKHVILCAIIIPGQFKSPTGKEMSNGQCVLILRGWGVKAATPHFTCGWQVKLCDPRSHMPLSTTISHSW